MKAGFFSRFGWPLLGVAALLAGAGGGYEFQNLHILSAGLVLFALCLMAHVIVLRRRAESDLQDQQASLRALVDGAVDAIITIDERGIIQAFNPAAERIFGYRVSEVVGRNVSILMPPTVAVDHDRYIARYLNTGERRIIGSGREVEARRKDGVIFPLELSVSESRLRGRRVFTGIGRDVAERRQAAEALRKANDQLAAQLAELEVRTREITLLGQMGDLLQSALEGKEAYRIVVDYAHQLFPATTGALCVADPARRLVEVMTSWGDGPVGERVFAPEDCWALRNGRPHWVEGAVAGGVCAHTGDTPIAGYACLPMTAQGEILGTLHLRVAVAGGIDAARRKLAAAFAEQVALALANLRLKETLRRQAIRDPLTGLYNRRYLEESLDRELRRAVRKGTPVGVLMLDLDHFKVFNDTHGHGAGDALLRALADHIQSGIRAEDIACRYGGEEFALIFPDATLEKAAMRAEQIRDSARKIQVDAHGQLLGGVTVSIGVAALPIHGNTPEALLRASDTALYSAKAQGRDRVVIAART